MPVTAPPLNARESPAASPCLAASAVRTLASTETRIPTYPAMNEATAPTRKPTPVFKSMLNQMMTKITIPVMDMVIN